MQSVLFFEVALQGTSGVRVLHLHCEVRIGLNHSRYDAGMRYIVKLTMVGKIFHVARAFGIKGMKDGIFPPIERQRCNAHDFA